MANLIHHSSLFVGEDHCYRIAGNECNAFVLGEVGSDDDFFLVGAEPEEENTPMLTGNILNSEGEVLFRLVRNRLLINPNDCSKFRSDLTSYEIHDSSGKMIMSANTVLEGHHYKGPARFVTTLAGNFYNKRGELVFSANSGEEGIQASVKCGLGFSGRGFGIAMDLSDEDTEIAKAILSRKGAIHRVVRGKVIDEDLRLDGCVLVNAELINCRVRVGSPDFAIVGSFILSGETRIDLEDPMAVFTKVLPAAGWRPA